VRDEDDVTPVHQWERRLLIIAFAGWAAVVAAYGQAIVNRVDKISEGQVLYQMTTERRITILEQQQVVIMQRQAWVVDTLNGRSHSQIP